MKEIDVMKAVENGADIRWALVENFNGGRYMISSKFTEMGTVYKTSKHLDEAKLYVRLGSANNFRCNNGRFTIKRVLVTFDENGYEKKRILLDK